MKTNASTDSTYLARHLSALTREDQGNLMAALVYKVGVERGPMGSKKVYGDDLVHTLIWTGFSYKALIKRSERKLQKLLDKGGLLSALAKAAWQENNRTEVGDACLAVQEFQEWFRRSLAVRDEGTEDPRIPQDPLWVPLNVDGVKIRGARVYNGVERMGDPRAPKPGTIYVQGVKLGEIVVHTGSNGNWKPESSPKTIAKRILKSMLPVGLFVQYKLDPERCMDVKVGDSASRVASEKNIQINPGVLRDLFKIAP